MELPKWKAIPLLVIFGTFDLLYLGANLVKVPDGGWFPLLIGAIAFILADRLGPRVAS